MKNKGHKTKKFDYGGNVTFCFTLASKQSLLEFSLCDGVSDACGA